ncbi:MAG: hypothetical protein KAR38_05910, partial [Calditrichia bacterium]|nr:hypothetical protein [Calditrichia bacterium]
DADKLKQELEVIQAPLLSPDYYKKAIEAYNEAKTRYEKRKSLGSIEKLLEDFKKYAVEAKEISRTAKIIFESTLNVRNEALQFKANEAAKELFNEAEEKFIKASKDYEDNDLEDAKKNAQKAEELYNKASLKAIKTSLLDEARIYIQEAKNLDAQKYSAKTYVKARQLKQEVEEILNSNLKAGTRVKGLAERATYEAKHTIALTKAVRKLKEKEANWELLILMIEEILGNVSSEFNYQPEFKTDLDKDLKKAQDDVVLSIQNLKEENLQLKKEVTTLQTDIEELQEKLGALQSSQQKVEDELKAKKELEEKIISIEKQFNKQEALVFRSENKVILRLY